MIYMRTATLRFDNLSRKDLSMIDRALSIASSSSCYRKHGAVIMRGGAVLSVGVNSYRNNCVNVTNPEANTSFHAEVAAIRACVNPFGSTLYIASVNRKGEARLSLPCCRCMIAIQKAGIKKIVYTV